MLGRWSKAYAGKVVQGYVGMWSKVYARMVRQGLCWNGGAKFMLGW